MRRYIDKIYQTGDVEPIEGGDGHMKLHGDYEQLILLQMIMERPGIYLLSSADFIQLHKKKSTKNASDSKNNRHTPSREPPLPLYRGLKLRSVTWSKKLVDHLNNIGINVSYSRVTQMESNIALATCKQF